MEKSHVFIHTVTGTQLTDFVINMLKQNFPKAKRPRAHTHGSDGVILWTQGFPDGFCFDLGFFLIFYLWCLSLILITEKLNFIVLYPVTRTGVGERMRFGYTE